MKIAKVISQHRRDMRVDLECEHCGEVEKNDWAYDDDNYHRNVVPNIKCKACGKISDENYRALTTKYAQGQQV